MIVDPYKVLGIPDTATDEELKKRYRELSKKYHPDANLGNMEAAEERFKEIQEAYRQITDARERGESGYGRVTPGYTPGQNYSSGYRPGQGAYGGTAYQYQKKPQQEGDRRTYAEYEDPYFGFGDFFTRWQQSQAQNTAGAGASYKTYGSGVEAAAKYIHENRYDEAIRALGAVTLAKRDAYWYFVAAIAHQGAGNNLTAVEFAKRAADMEPGNTKYRDLLRLLQSSGQRYETRGKNYGEVGAGATWCLSMIALNLLCNCC